MYEENPGEIDLVRVSARFELLRVRVIDRESTVSQTRTVGVDAYSDPGNGL